MGEGGGLNGEDTVNVNQSHFIIVIYFYHSSSYLRNCMGNQGEQKVH